ncbi:MAG: Pr6Pr family membrane protein [Demequinaceae bacterium]|nr:Pr6Pr family membrane protein [Demequinaceae bacterium]
MRVTNIVSAVLRVIVAGIALLTVVNLLSASGPKGLLTFTVQSNTMMAVSFLWTAHTLVWRKHTPPEWLSGSSVFYLAITGIVYNFVLGPEISGSSPAVILGLSNSTLEHVVTPIAAMAIWVIFDEHRRIPWRYVWIWLLYLIGYLVVILTVIVLVDSFAAPYPFLDIDTLGVGGVAWRLTCYMAGFAVLSAAMIGLDHGLPERTALSEYDPHDQG